MDIVFRFPQFASPSDVTDHEFAFGVSDPDRLMPPVDALEPIASDLSLWSNLARHIRHNGLDPQSKIRVRDGITPQQFMRHLGACMATQIPPQERDLRVGALLSAWVEYIRIPGGPVVSSEMFS